MDLNNQNDDKVKFTFIAYLITALDRHRRQYIQKQEKIDSYEIPLSIFEENSELDFLKLVIDFEDYLPIEQQIVDAKVFSALKSLRPRENTVLITKVIGEYSFKEIALLLGIPENRAKTLYYSALSKMRIKLQGDDLDD